MACLKCKGIGVYQEDCYCSIPGHCQYCGDTKKVTVICTECNNCLNCKFSEKRWFVNCKGHRRSKTYCHYYAGPGSMVSMNYFCNHWKNKDIVLLSACKMPDYV